MAREEGFYWVKNKREGWEIAYYTGYSWWRVQDDDTYQDDYFEEIDEVKIKRS